MLRWYHTAFPHPMVIRMDNAFKGKKVSETLNSLGVIASYGPVFHPRSNPAERAIRTIRSQINRVAGNERWTEIMPLICEQINVSPHSSHKYSPFLVQFGRHPSIGSPKDGQPLRDPVTFYRKVHRRLVASKAKYADEGLKPITLLEPGTPVHVKVPQKTVPQPAVIIKDLGACVYVQFDGRKHEHQTLIAKYRLRK